MGLANIGVSKEWKTTRNGDDTYFRVYKKGNAVYGKENLGDSDINVITVYSIVFIISQDKLT
jgi:hypothetical protein